MAGIQVMAPTLFGAVSARQRRTLVSDALLSNAWVRHITGAYSVQVIKEFTGTPDVFRWRFMADECYSSALAYGAMFIGSSRPHGAREIWRTSPPPRVRFFFWLVMHGRC
jgi:hypothetical protein